MIEIAIAKHGFLPTVAGDRRLRSMVGSSGEGGRASMARQPLDLITDLPVPADRHAGFRLSVGRGDELPRDGGPDPRDGQKPFVQLKAMFDKDLPIERLNVKAWNFQ
jgi:hypothetical protein